MNSYTKIVVIALCTATIQTKLLADNYNEMMRAIGPDLDTAFRAIDPGEKTTYSNRMNDLHDAINTAKNAATQLTQVPKNMRRAVDQIFSDFNGILMDLRGGKTTNKWLEFKTKPEKIGILNALPMHLKQIDQHMEKLKKMEKKALYTTPKDLARNVIVSIEGCKYFLTNLSKYLAS